MNNYKIRLNTNLITFLILLIVPLQQIAIDIYLPSLPAMKEFFHTDMFWVQITLTGYILGLGISQLFYGPASDSFGRKKIILSGICLSLIASIMIIFAKNIHLLIIARVIEGLGLGSCFVVSSSIISDVFKGKDLARISTFSTMVYALPPIIAPVFGSYLQHFFNWQANFIFVTLYTAILLIILLVKQPETNKHIGEHPFKFSPIIKSYAEILSHVKFISYLSCLMLAFGLMITFNVVGPFLLQSTLHVSIIHYGQLLLFIGLSYLMGTSLNSKLMQHFSTENLVWCGHILMVTSGIVLIIFSGTDLFTSTIIVSLTCLSIFGTGLVFPNCYAFALEIFPKKVGIASACIGASGLLGCSLISTIVAGLHINNEFVLGLTYLVISLLSCLVFYVTRHKTIT